MRSTRIFVIRCTLSSDIRSQKPSGVSKILIYLAGHILERIARDVRIKLATQRRVPVVVAGGPRQHRGERGEEIAKRPSDDDIIVEINVKRD